MGTSLHSSSNYIKLSDEAMDKLLEPIPEEIIIEKVAEIRGWKVKRVPFEEDQSKRDYFSANIDQNMTLEMLRDLRMLREHSRITSYRWLLYNFDRSIARYYPNKIDERFEKELLKMDNIVNLDSFVVNEKSKTVFILLEEWRKEVVADTFLSRVETNVPKYFRAYLNIPRKMLIVQEKNQNATQRFIELFEEAFNVGTEKIVINAMTVRQFVRKTKSKIQRLIVRVPQEIAGFGGLSRLAFYGEDVLMGARGLMTRHDTSPFDVGPWTGVSNEELHLDVGKSVKTKTIDDILWLYDLIEEL
jgi:hypothetical protein